MEAGGCRNEPGVAEGARGTSQVGGAREAKGREVWEWEWSGSLPPTPAPARVARGERNAQVTVQEDASAVVALETSTPR